MTAENESTVVLLKARTAFEAETVAAALKARGLDARVVDDAAPRAIGFAEPVLAAPKVIVLAHEADAARAALAEVRAEAPQIDWDAVDLGDAEEAQKLVQASRARRWVLTLILVLVPAGLFTLSYAVNRADAALKMLGGVLLATAVVLLLSHLASESRRPRSPGPRA